MGKRVRAIYGDQNIVRKERNANVESDSGTLHPKVVSRRVKGALGCQPRVAPFAQLKRNSSGRAKNERIQLKWKNVLAERNRSKNGKLAAPVTIRRPRAR